MTTHTLEVWGDLACFTRPEMKVERFSYPVITPSAARGIFDAIYWDGKREGSRIFTEADDLPTLHKQLRDAVHCHFADAERPRLIHLHITREEVLQA